MMKLKSSKKLIKMPVMTKIAVNIVNKSTSFSKWTTARMIHTLHTLLCRSNRTYYTRFYVEVIIHTTHAFM